MMRRSFYAVLFLFICGCTSLLKPAPARELYVLKVPPCTIQGSAHNSAVLLIRNTTAGPLFDSQQIVFNDTEQTRGFYEFASWAESPARQLTALLIERFECSGLFASVSGGQVPVLANYELSTQLTEFRHDFATRPGKGLVEIRAELIDLNRRALIASKTFSVALTVNEFDVAGAVDALSRASTEVLEQIVVWVRRSV